jgi:aspartate racemase
MERKGHDHQFRLNFMNRYFIVLIMLIMLSCNKFSNNKIETKTHQNMRTLGLIGGLSWHSTIEYYQTINQAVNEHFHNNTNPPLLVYTLNQAEVHRFQKENKWDSIAFMLTSAAFKLRSAGAEAVLFCANTPHKVYDDVQQELDFPILHIADATAKAITQKGISKVGFIGTKYSMEENFITNRLAKNGIEVLVPKDSVVINELHRIIHEELSYGKIVPESKQYVIKVLKSMIDMGAEGIVLGCTEFPLLISQANFSIPVLNTAEIHSMAAVSFILNLDDTLPLTK